ncbi:hypothetical protein AVEN_49720-1 [Araneus ventricosus]|uniref:Uncharacterized protein n=1 Tax=Araneus ventricosus TaxID=182803 RepID=A0A4Y2FF10_ARAVE|nr:hypothetical protein AVEN_49720-1 [Araneus ventricosus]
MQFNIVTKLECCFPAMPVLWLEREICRDPYWMEANDSRPWRQNEVSENTGIIVLFLLGADIVLDEYLTSRRVRKSIKTVVPKRENNLSRVLSTVRAGKLIEAERY